MFDINEIKLNPSGNTLHHSLQFFTGFLISDDSKPKPNPLIHKGEGRFISPSQVMNFKTKEREKLLGLLGELVPLDQIDTRPFEVLTEPGEQKSWRAACTDRIQLQTDNSGNLTTTPEWGLTRVDFYTRGKGRPEFMSSLLYTIWNPDASEQDAPDGFPINSGVPLEVFDGTGIGL